jgi:hypothetical protein
MRRKWFCIIVGAFVLAGCSPQGGPASEKADKPSIFGVPSIAGPGMTDEFGLPLVIELNPPPVPKELLGPTPMPGTTLKTPDTKTKAPSTWTPGRRR